MKARKAEAAKPVITATVSVDIPAPADKVYEALLDISVLPQWAQPVKSIRRDGEGFAMEYMLPDGPVPCRCDEDADPARKTVDWTVRFKGGEPIRIYSRVLPVGPADSTYVFTFTSPPLPARMPKDPLGAIRKNLSKDLEKLRDIVVRRAKSAGGPAR